MMPVYVDNARIPYGRMKMSHMFADTREELISMARAINLDTRHIQNEGAPNEHFDVSSTYRDKAIAKGAIEIDQRGLVKLIKKKRAAMQEAQVERFAEVVASMVPDAGEPADADDYGSFDYGDDDEADQSE